MKGKGLQLRRAHVLGLSVLVLAGAAVFLGTTDSDAVMVTEFPGANKTDSCEFEGFHWGQISSQGDFDTATTESMTATTGEKYIDRNGLSTLPIQIRGMSGRGFTEGVGDIMYWLDKSRPVEGSMMRAKMRGSAFPARHEMRFHLLLTADSLPGRTFRSINPAVMVNDNATSFPPKPGARYVLRDVVEFEDVEDPGVVVVRILSNRNQVISKPPLSGPGLRPTLEN